MKKQREVEKTQLIVQAPLMTRAVMMALRDREPMEGVRFSLAMRRGYTLKFNVSTSSGALARSLALKLLEQAGLADSPELDVSVV